VNELSRVGESSVRAAAARTAQASGRDSSQTGLWTEIVSVTETESVQNPTAAAQPGAV